MGKNILKGTLSNVSIRRLHQIWPESPAKVTDIQSAPGSSFRSASKHRFYKGNLITMDDYICFFDNRVHSNHSLSALSVSGRWRKKGWSTTQ